MGKPKKEKNLKLIDGKWYIDFTFNKKRIRQFGGYTKEQARIKLLKLKIEKQNEKLGFKKPDSRTDAPFEQFTKEFIELYSKQNKKSWKSDESSLKNLRPFFKGKMLSQIKPELVERYKAKRKSEIIERQEQQIKDRKREVISLATVNRELAFLKTMLNKAVEWDRLEVSPLKNVKKFKEPEFKNGVLTREKAKSLIEVAENHLKPILIIALNTGMRKNEILSLKWKNTILSKRYIHIEDSKSGKSRDIPLNSLVIEALAVIPQDSEYVFYNLKTKRPIRDVKTAFKTACKNAGIDYLRFHDLRHTAATRMVEVGTDLVTVSKILGHSSIQMTMRYAHPTPENMRRATEKLGEFYEKTPIRPVTKVDRAKTRRLATPLIPDN